MKVQDKLDEVKHYLSDSYGITTKVANFTQKKVIVVYYNKINNSK